MHNRTAQAVPALAEMDHTAATLSAMVGFAGMLLWFSVALGMWGLRRSSRTAPYIGGHMWVRLCVYALALGAFYPIATLNRIVVERPGDGALVPLSMVALNALVWCTVCSEWLAWFTKYDGNPPHWDIYDLLHHVAALSVAVIAFGSLASENVRFINLLAMIPLVATLVWAATAEAAPTRSLLLPAPSLASIRAETTRPRLAALAFALVGTVSFVLEMLTPSYGNVVGVGVAAVFMLAEHAALAVPLLLMATASDLPLATRTATPPRRRESPPVQTLLDDPAPLPAPTAPALMSAAAFNDWGNDDADQV